MGATGSPDRDEAARFFRDKYLSNGWGGESSRSGPGSEGAFGRQKQRLLSRIVDRHGVRSVLDIGCGDLFWMRPLLARFERYLGVDVVPELVASNSRKLSEAGLVNAEVRRIDVLDSRAWPEVRAGFDLVLCLDVIGHLLADELDALLRFLLEEQEAPLLLLTNRRDATSARYLERPKTRHEGVDMELHPRFGSSGFRRIESSRARYPGDCFDLYRAPR